MIKKILFLILLAIPISCYAITNVFESKLEIIEDKFDTEGYIKANIRINVNYNLNAISAIVKYDKKKIVIEKIEDASKFEIIHNIDYDESGSYISGSYTKGLDGEFILCNIIFRKTNSFIAGDKTTIELVNIEANNNTKGISNAIILSIPKNENKTIIEINDKNNTVLEKSSIKEKKQDIKIKDNYIENNNKDKTENEELNETVDENNNKQKSTIQKNEKQQQKKSNVLKQKSFKYVYIVLLSIALIIILIFMIYQI